MEIKGTVHCLFEQSGTFKDEFIRLGIHAEDYDIQNAFGKTDHVCDLFAEIDTAFDGGGSIFDGFGKDDLVLAFYPCIYFCATSQMAFYMGCVNYRCLSDTEKISKIIERNAMRSEFYVRLIKLVSVCLQKNIRLVIENPWSEQTYLKANFLKAPDVVDMDRTKRGDVFKKPTAYWFWGCKPTKCETFSPSKEKKTIMSAKGASKAGVCSTERSMISKEYARCFIGDFILGRPASEKSAQQCDLFDCMEVAS